MTVVTLRWSRIAREFDCMTALIRYDAARRAIASAYRVDEAKNIRDKAEGVRVYAKQARDLEMQNMAAEIRIRAGRRAGQLLSYMAKNPGTRGEGRPLKDGTKSRRSSSATRRVPESKVHPGRATFKSRNALGYFKH